MEGLGLGLPSFLWQRATSLFVGCFAGRTWKNNNKWYILQPKPLCNFNNNRRSKGSVLALSTHVHGFKPGRSRRIFKDEKKIINTTSFGGEVKPSVPCRRFAACRRSLRREQRRHVGKITGKPFVAMISSVVAEVETPGGESGDV